MAGIFIRLQFPFPESIVLWFLLITLFALFCLTVFNKLSSNFKYRWLFGSILQVFIFCLGIFLTGEKYKVSSYNITRSGSLSEYIGVIAEAPETRTNSVRCIVDISQEKGQNRFFTCKEKILCYLQKDPVSQMLKAGDALLFKTTIEDVDASGNPYEFDFRKYLSYQGIRFSAYINKNSWQCLAHNKLPVLLLWANRMRDKLLSMFTKLGMTGDEFGVASALTIGDKAGLDDEIKRAYVASGTMHILAVSGMHVALLYWVLNMLLSFLDRNTYASYLKLILLLVAVWFYAVITGMGGSILRAAAMITFVIFGQASNRRINIFNSLAASAFFLLVINPYNLTDVGFQLSYIAVISIVVFYPLIYPLIDIKNWLGNQIWSLTAVTLAAQIITTPVSLFYFHQFPNLFLVSNLIMIPLSTLIMYFAMILIVCSGWHWLAGFMGKIFNFMVWLLNKVVLTIESLPYALFKGIYITWFDICLLYILTCFITLYLLRKRIVYFVLGLCTIFVFIFYGLIREYQGSIHKEVIVYHENNNSVLQFRNGNQSIWLVSENNERINRYIERARDAMYSNENQVILLDSVIRQSKGKGLRLNNWLWIRGNFLQFGSKKVLITDGKEVRDIMDYSVHVDYLIIRNSKVFYAENVFQHYLTSKVVIDSSNSKFKAKRLEKIFTDKNIPVFNILSSGALRIEL
jgi:competence protein ComEC